MIVPLAIAALWLVGAGLLWVAGQGSAAAGCAALSPAALALTVYLRRLKERAAAAKYLTGPARGLTPQEAAARLAELAPEGIEIDTDDLPGWPMKLILLLGLGGLLAVGLGVLAALG